MGIEHGDSHPLTVAPHDVFGLVGSFRNRESHEVDAVEIILSRRELNELVQAKHREVQGILSGYYSMGLTQS